MPECVIRLFGEPEVLVGGRQVRLGVALPLLAVLAVWRRRDDIPAWEVADLLHTDLQRTAGRGDEGDIEQRASWTLIKRKGSLRRKLGLTLSGRQTLTDLARAISGLAWVDVVRFDELVESDAPERLREAVALRGRGPLFSGRDELCLDPRFVDEERAMREKHYRRALTRLVEADRPDRPHDALRYLDLRLAAGDLSAERTAKLHEERRALEREVARRPAPAAPSHNLPARVSTFFGRTAEIAAVKALLGEKRLVTLTGAGGCGKSRLALQVATELFGAGRGGAWLVELASVTDPGLVPWAVAQPFGLPEQKSRSFTDLLVEHLKPQRLLLVVDNCEHLADACASLVERLLLSCPGVSVLATSREPLDIDGEKLYRVPGLGFPDPDNLPFGAPDPAAAVLCCDAVRLLTDRANLHTEFALDLDSLAPVAVICKQLDGIPLALELAAARIGELSVAEVAAQLGDCFRLRTRGRRTALPRHATLDAAMDWSYDLLNPDERMLLCRLSVFRGGWTWEAAEMVCADDDLPAGEVAGLLRSLTRKSLLSADSEGASARYGMLETVRQYAQNRLRERGDWDQTRRRHRGFYLRLAEEADGRLRGPDQKHWLDVLETEHGNLRAALNFCRQHPQSGDEWMRLVGRLWWFWWVRGYIREGQSHLAEALAHSQGDTASSRIRALEGAGNFAQHQGNYDEAQALLEQGLGLLRERGDTRGIASILGSLGNLAHNGQRYAEAHARHLESLDLFRGLNDARGVAVALLNLGNVAYEEKRFGAAWELFQESRELFARSQDERNVALSLYSLGNTAREQKRHSEAAALLGNSLRLFRSWDDRWSIAHLLEAMASLSIGRKQCRRAAVLWGASESLRERLGTPIAAGERSFYDLKLSAAREALGEKAFRAAWAEGRQMTWEQAVAFALEETERNNCSP